MHIKRKEKAQFLDQLLSLPVDVREGGCEEESFNCLGKFMMRGTFGRLKNKKVKRKRKEGLFLAFFILETWREYTR